MKITQQRNNDKNTTLSTMSIDAFVQKVRILTASNNIAVFRCLSGG